MTRIGRRQFLGGSLALGATLSLPLGSLESLASAAPSTPAKGAGNLLVIFLKGGNDGLNTIGPFADGVYHDLRGALANDPLAAHPAGHGQFFHPALQHTHDRWVAGDVRVLPAVGESSRDHSHFSSQPRWMSGISPTTHTGWLARWLDAQTQGTFGASVDGGASSQIRGSAGRTLGITRSPSALLPTGPESRHVTIAMKNWDPIDGSPARTLMARGLADAVWASDTQGPVHDVAVGEDSRFTADLRRAAAAFNLGVGVRVVSASLGGFDTHTDQAGTHASLLADLDAGLAAFDATLNPDLVSYTTTLVVSEFGRRAASNSSAGTDHGAAGLTLVIGGHVKGGLDHAPASLSDLDERGDLRHAVDFRRVYASVISDWLGGDPTQVLGGQHNSMDLFSGSPGDPIVVGANAPSPNAGVERFVDVNSSAYYSGALAWAVAEGIVTGTSANTFAPDQPMTRAGFATVVHRAAGRPAATGQPVFRDVKSSDWYSEAVAWMASTGITTGTSPTQFSPTQGLTRGEAATFLWRWQGAPSAPVSDFEDVPHERFFSKAVDWMVSKGVTTGTSPGRFSPADSVTRGQAVTFLWRLAGSPIR